MGTADIIRSANIYEGGCKPPRCSQSDLTAPAMLIDPTLCGSEGDFRPAAGSPALGLGEWRPVSPCSDILGNARPRSSVPTAGAYQSLAPVTPRESP